MPKTKRLPVVRIAHRRNRTPTGKRTVTPARKAANYFAFGQKATQQRGDWLGPDGKPHTHEAVLVWANSQARQHEHTFQALLSVPQARLTGQAYAHALEAAGQPDEWRLVVHNDTAYSHAHVLFFRDRRLPRDEFEQWQTTVQQALLTLEEKRLAEPELGIGDTAERVEAGHFRFGPELG